jgi:hypothetical protein
MTLHHPPAAAASRANRLGRRLAHLAAHWWWMVRTHVAEQHLLPRGSAGPEPRWDDR